MAGGTPSIPQTAPVGASTPALLLLAAFPRHRFAGACDARVESCAPRSLRFLRNVERGPLTERRTPSGAQDSNPAPHSLLHPHDSGRARWRLRASAPLRFSLLRSAPFSACSAISARSSSPPPAQESFSLSTRGTRGKRCQPHGLSCLWLSLRQRHGREEAQRRGARTQRRNDEWQSKRHRPPTALRAEAPYPIVSPLSSTRMLIFAVGRSISVTEQYLPSESSTALSSFFGVTSPHARYTTSTSV